MALSSCPGLGPESLGCCSHIQIPGLYSRSMLSKTATRLHAALEPPACDFSEMRYFKGEIHTGFQRTSIKKGNELINA